MAQSKTLVLGIGNTLLCDEGAGIHALELMRRRFTGHASIEYLDGGTLSFSLASWIEDCDNLMVFDAAELHMAPGAVQAIVGEDMDRFLGMGRRSAHEVGLLDLMDIARLSEALPKHRALIGVQPVSFDWATSPSPEVAASLDDMVMRAAELIEQWSPDTLQLNSQYENLNAAEINNKPAERFRGETRHGTAGFV